jgi:hypothetical protein
VRVLEPTLRAAKMKERTLRRRPCKGLPPQRMDDRLSVLRTSSPRRSVMGNRFDERERSTKEALLRNDDLDENRERSLCQVKTDRLIERRA